MEIIIITDPQHQHDLQRELQLPNVRQAVLQQRHDLLLAHQPINQEALLHRLPPVSRGGLLHPPQPVSQDHLLHRHVPHHQAVDQDQWDLLRPDQEEELALQVVEVEVEGGRLAYYFIQTAYPMHPSLLHSNTGRLFFQTDTYSYRC